MRKKIFVLCISALCLFTCFACTVTHDTSVAAYISTETKSAVNVGDNISVSSHIYINGDFTGVSVPLPTYTVSGKYSADISVYKWNENYKKTIAAEPLATKTFTRLQDNAPCILKFSALPKGEYLIRVHNAVGSVGVYQMTKRTVSLGYTFLDNVEQTRKGELMMDIIFRGTAPTEPFVKIASVTASYGNAPVYEEITEDQTDYSEYNLPEESLFNSNKAMPDTWVFNDALGRKSLTNADVGNPREGKTLAMFYWTWHQENSNFFNNQELLDKLAAEGADIDTVIHDYSNPVWPTVGYNHHFWNSPVYGYYRTSTDCWVMRKQAELLTNAGVDVIFTDNTNGTMTWKTSYRNLLKTWTQAQKDGVDTPKVSYMLPFGGGTNSNTQITDIYLDYFRDGEYRSLWYYFDGKPLILAQKSCLDLRGPKVNKEMNEFFTFRACNPDYLTAGSEDGSTWGWLSMYPQAVYTKRDGTIEQIAVGVAQNHNTVTHSLTAMNGENVADRTYTSKGYDTRENAKLYGANFEEQFNYALEKDPQVIFVTGWNEWHAGRYQTWCGVANAFPDTYNDIASRDIEPSRGELKDNYYYQLVNYIRRYKGVREMPKANGKTEIDITKDASQWSGVQPYFASYIGNTGNRDATGYSGVHYTDTSGRNDIIGTQMTQNDTDIFILVECAEDITPYTDKLWMNVYLDTTGEYDGWESFNYVINKTTPKNEHTAYLEKFTGNGYESRVVAEVEYSVRGRYLQIKIPKTALEISGDKFTVNYSVTDNVHDFQGYEDTGIYDTFSGDIIDFYSSGDVAPGGRFKYSYIAE